MRSQILTLLAPGAAAFTALALGLLGICAEFCVPGWVLPGVLGGILALLGLASLAALSINPFGTLLLIAGAALLPRSKWAALSGAVLLVCGARILVIGPDRIEYLTALAVSLPFAALTRFLATTAIRARRQKFDTGASEE